jgi:probable HAF family extracellular repeat protein
MRRIIILLPAFIALLTNTYAFGQVQYNVTDLGTLPGYSLSNAAAINNSGQVVGWVTNASNPGIQEAFIYSNGTMTGLGIVPGGNTSAAVSINASGQVLGSSGYYGTGSEFIDAVTYSGSQVNNIGSLGSLYCIPTDINDEGQIVGRKVLNLSQNYKAFLYSGGTTVNIGSSFPFESQANGINDSGQIVGSYKAPASASKVNQF